MRISNEYTKDTAGSEAVDRPEPQQGLRDKVTDICFKNGSVTKPMVDELMQLIEQTLHDCLPQKRDTGNPYGTTDGAISSSEAYGFNAAIDQTQDNLKRRMES